MRLAFHMTVDQALQFFELANDLGLETEQEKVALLQEMIAAGFDITVFKTNRTKDQIVSDYSKHGSVLYVKSEDSNVNRN